MQQMGAGAPRASANWGPGGLPVCRNGGGGPVGIAKLGSGGVPVLPKSVCRKVAEILPRLGFTKVCVGRLRNSRPAAQMGDWGWPAEWGKRPAVPMEHGGGPAEWGKRPAVPMGHWGGPAKWGKGAAWGIGALAFARSQPRGERGDAVLLKGRRGKRAPKTREKGACGAHGSSSVAGRC